MSSGTSSSQTTRFDKVLAFLVRASTTTLQLRLT